MLERVFVLNFKLFDVSDSLGERIRVASVGIRSRLTCHVHRVNFGKQDCGSL